ncbi:thioredoxin family protein [Halobacteriovorax sp. HLS]|uniref:protein-disulfide reductase DsbD family protein n=1 Tax=Halobacteriovorax sp. HLS TaxID=2234000 RepID=UPI000FD9915C|nr:thioredoxin family protein [Halobacteriovorax sp. HLS]
MFFRIVVLLLVSLSSFAGQDKSEENIPKLPVKFYAQVLKVQNQNYLALNYSNHKKWHTYWKNPGDAGLALAFKFKINNQETTLEELEWPVPKKYIEKGDMLAFGYEDEYSIFFKLPQKSEDHKISIYSNWLVCKHVCIPGEITVSGKISNNELTELEGNTFVQDKDTTLEHFQKLPKQIEFPTNLDLILSKGPDKDSNKLNLYYNFSTKSALNYDRSRNLLTPFPVEPFSWTREKVYKDKNGNLYASYPIEWDGEYMEPEMPLPKDGVFKEPFELKFLFANPENGQISIIKKTFRSFSLDSGDQFQRFTELLKPISFSNEIKAQSTSLATLPIGESKTGLLSYLIFAFIGGLILNFMPCVLPVISIKLFSLIQHKGQSKKKILKHNLSYTLGILFTFAVLALTIVLFKQAGEQVGWGFQLQSPTFVLSMIFVLFIFALNMFGLFEFRTPGGSKLGNIKTDESFIGDFLSGVLATILSTPCSAPFLGTALTFAFTSSTAMIFLVFIFIGLGLAFPFILTALIPSTIAFLPRPGMWMEKLKKFLGITLILTAIWLTDVFLTLQGDFILLKLNIALALCFFAFYMQKNITKSKLFICLAHLLYILLIGNILLTPQQTIESTSSIKESHSELKWEKWSETAMNKAKEDNKLVFMDFTAKWCFTCKVNERLVIETDDFKKLVKQKNVTLLLGDWTKRDPIIGKWLRTQGHVGVPAYFVINSKGELIKLGETITISKIEKSLN